MNIVSFPDPRYGIHTQERRIWSHSQTLGTVLTHKRGGSGEYSLVPRPSVRYSHTREEDLVNIVSFPDPRYGTHTQERRIW